MSGLCVVNLLWERKCWVKHSSGVLFFCWHSWEEVKKILSDICAVPLLARVLKITDWAQEKAGILKRICKCGFILGKALKSVRVLGEGPWMWFHDEGRPQIFMWLSLSNLGSKKGGVVRWPQRGLCGWMEITQTTRLLNWEHSFSVSLFPSLPHSFSLLLSFVFLVLFFKLPARQLKDPITLYHIPVSQIYCSSLPDVRKVKWLSKVTGCIFLQPQGRGGLLIRTHQVWIFQKRCLQKSQRTGGLLFFFLTRWPDVFLLIVVDLLTLLLSKHLLKICCYGVLEPRAWMKRTLSLPLRSLQSIGDEGKNTDNCPEMQQML